MRARVCAVSFLAFLALGAAAGVQGVYAARGDIGGGAVLSGGFSAGFEKVFNRALAPADVARRLWGRAEYALFGEGRDGVVVGADGWLFTAEEFSCPRGSGDVLAGNLARMEDARRRIAARGAVLAVVLVPSKARAFAGHLGGFRMTPCRAGVYGAVRARLAALKIPSPDLLPVFAGMDDAWMRTDTHWSPFGARLAAQAMARAVRAYPRMDFTTARAGRTAHAGDLARFLPGVEIAKEDIEGFETVPVSGGLLDDAPRPSVALVGTSFSAMAAWHFPGFLKAALKADVAVHAAEGEGPFAVMDRYLDEEKNLPPLVVWEVPERYFLQGGAEND